MLIYSFVVVVVQQMLLSTYSLPGFYAPESIRGLEHRGVLGRECKVLINILRYVISVIFALVPLLY